MRIGLILIMLCFLLPSHGQTFLFQEDFSGGIPAQWTLVNDNNTPHPSVSQFTQAWISTQDPADTSNKVIASTSYFTSPAKANRRIFTNYVQLGAYGNVVHWSAKSQDLSFPDSYLVVVLDSATQVMDTVASIQFENNEWVERNVHIGLLGYNNQTVKIGFILNSTDAYILYLDDIAVETQSAVSLKEIEQELQLVYTPNQGYSFDHTEFKSLEIMGLDGKLFAEVPMGTYFELPSGGLFIIRAEINGRTFTRKIANH